MSFLAGELNLYDVKAKSKRLIKQGVLANDKPGNLSKQEYKDNAGNK